MIIIAFFAFLSVASAANDNQNGFLSTFSKVIPTRIIDDNPLTSSFNKMIPNIQNTEINNAENNRNSQFEKTTKRNEEYGNRNGNPGQEASRDSNTNGSNGFFNNLGKVFGTSDSNNDNAKIEEPKSEVNSQNYKTPVTSIGNQNYGQTNTEKHLEKTTTRRIDSNTNDKVKNEDKKSSKKNESSGFLSNLGNVFGKTDEKDKNNEEKSETKMNGTKQNDTLATSIGKGIQTEIQAVLTPIDETLVSIGSSQCKNVKKILGVTYDQLDGDSEPDLNQLSLQWSDGSTRVVFNITQAARTLPAVRGYDAHKPLIIFLHGFTDDPTKTNAQNIVKSFQEKGEYNVLSLDASSLIHWLYLRSTSYVRFIGEELGAVLAAMVHSGVDPAKIHLIGHSLGSHISGFTGKTFTALTGKRVGRISGLDPAGPCFSAVEPDLKLKATDADFVDVIHTDTGVYGLKENIGHVDFLVNSGQQQPNCLFQTCSHSRAVVYYAESIASHRAFPALSCASWDHFRNGKCDKDNIAYMGFPAKPTLRGQFYLQTDGESPYGRGDRGLKFQNNEGIVRNILG